MANPILSWLRGDDLRALKRQSDIVQPVARVEQRKLYFYPDGITPSMASDIGPAIRLGTLVHGPGASDLIYKAWHYEDSNSAVYACLSAICTAYPEAPIKVFRETDTADREHLPDHPLQLLLNKPNPFLAREHLWHYIQWCKHVGGNAFVRKVRSGAGLPVELWPISPMKIQPVTTKEDAFRGRFISYYAYKYDDSKDPERIPVEDIVHFKLGIDDRDHRLGQSPLAKLVREVAGDDEAHRWQTDMLSNGGAIGMLIEVPVDSTLTEDQATAMKTGFEERFGGRNRGRTGVLMGGASAKPYGFSPSDMDMKALHRIPEERIAAVMRVPAIIAGLGAGLDRSTYANFREAREMFAEMTLLPLYAFDAATINMQLTPEFASEGSGITAAFDITDLRAFQEDEDAKWARLDKAVKTGWVRKNEARTDVGLPPDMDDNAPLPGQLVAAPLEDDDEREQERRSRVVAELKAMDLESLPEWLQAIVDFGEPGFERALDRYLDGQRKRVKRRLVSGG